jgi:hypothetical protein
MAKKNGHEIWHLGCLESTVYRAVALGLVTSEIEKYRMDLVGVGPT